MSQVAAAIFGITQEDIHHWGATNIPDLLRMAPGMDVTQINANTWAISVRGFNSQFSGKLLVLMDGRAVYTPLFGEVSWDTQDVPLEDIERIEVIRGPGGGNLGRQCGEWGHQHHHEKSRRQPGDHAGGRRRNARARVRHSAVRREHQRSHELHMPGMDGFTLVERIRERPELSTAAIMMLTSAGHRGDAARCQELGVSAYLLKPIRQSE